MSELYLSSYKTSLVKSLAKYAQLYHIEKVNEEQLNMTNEKKMIYCVLIFCFFKT